MWCEKIWFDPSWSPVHHDDQPHVLHGRRLRPPRHRRGRAGTDCWRKCLKRLPWKYSKKRYQANSKWTKGALRWSPIELPWVTLPRSACEYLTERGDEDEIYTCFVGCKNIQKMCRVSFIPWEERKKFYHEEKHFCKRSCCFLQTNMSAATEKPAPACFIFPSSWRLSTHLIRKMGEKISWF